MGKQAKRNYKPLNANSMRTSGASPAAFGASSASRLADHLRNRRSSGQSQCSPSLHPEVFGPALGSIPRAQQAIVQEQSSTWAQRAQGLCLKLSLPDESCACLQGVSSSASVGELKQRIEKEHGIRAAHQTLSFFGNRLADHASLADSGVASGALITVIFRSRASETSVKSQVSASHDGYPALVSSSKKQVARQLDEKQLTSVTLPSKDALTLEREDLLQQVFILIDKDGDGFLSCDEMYSLASLTGFDGSETEWAEEYTFLCTEHGLDETVGATQEVFIKLINDDSDNGIHCTDDELHQMMLKLAGP